jgi:uncharacterized membrane protein YdfJ with MMPL/SSD domain
MVVEAHSGKILIASNSSAKRPVASLTKMATAIVAVGMGLAIIGLLGRLVYIPEEAPTLGTMLGLGVGIDYALFLVMRHRNLLEKDRMADLAQSNDALTGLRDGNSVLVRETQATAMEPAIAVKKRRRSVSTTPRTPPMVLKATVTPPARSTVVRGLVPRSTPAILMAASVTVAMIMTLKKTPR